MDPFEARLKSLPLRKPSPQFGRPETLARLREAQRSPHPILQRMLAMPWTSKSAALVGMLAVGFVSYVVLVGPMGSSIAFAQVAEKLRAAQTMSFDSVIKIGVDEKKETKVRTYFMAPGKIRQEMRSGEEEGFAVMDFSSGKALMVSTTQKTAFLSPIKGGSEVDIVRNEIDELRSLKDKDSLPLGEKQIDGVRATGFEISSREKVTTAWADAQSGDPLRIEFEWKDSPVGPATEVMTNFKFDAKLDPAIFSLEPPQGYKSAPFMPIDLNATPATNLAGFLKIYADHMDGEFPPRLDLGALKSLSAKLAKSGTEGQPSDEQLKAISYGAGLMKGIMTTKANERWQYYPDVKRGQKDRILFWWLDQKNNTYSAVYGDLRVEKITKDQLPPADRTQK
jgi:outer membrane lipoprotein-sorting protein